MRDIILPRSVNPHKKPLYFIASKGADLSSLKPFISSVTRYRDVNICLLRASSS